MKRGEIRDCERSRIALRSVRATALPHDLVTIRRRAATLATKKGEPADHAKRLVGEQGTMI
jgi:hypothetical protein